MRCRERPIIKQTRGNVGIPHPGFWAVALRIVVGCSGQRRKAPHLLGAGGVALATRPSVTMQVSEPPAWIGAACPHRQQPGRVLPAVMREYAPLGAARRCSSAKLHCKIPSCEPESAPKSLPWCPRPRRTWSFSDLTEQTGMCRCRSLVSGLDQVHFLRFYIVSFRLQAAVFSCVSTPVRKHVWPRGERYENTPRQGNRDTS